MEEYILQAVFILIISILFVGFLKRILQPSIKSIPGPKNDDSEHGNLVDIGKAGSLHEYLKLNHKKFGPLFGFVWGQQYVVSICSPQLYKRTLNLHNRPPELFKFFEPLLSKDSIQYANDMEMKNRRRLYDLPFSHNSCKNYYEIIQPLTDEFVEKWDNLQSDEPVDVFEDILALAVKMIFATSFSSEFVADQENVDQMLAFYSKSWEILEKSLTHGYPKEGTLEYKDLNNGIDYMKTTIKDIICKKKESMRVSPDPNFLDTIVEAELPINKVLADSISYIIGGFHTSGNLIAWALFFMAGNPDVQMELYAELKDVLGDEPINPNCISQIKYLKQVIDESLRCSTLAPWAARVSDYDITMDNCVIPKETPIIYALGVTLEDANLWPEPEKFDPSRFTPDKNNERNSLTFSPFGFAGKRMCPGYKFAYVEAYIVLSTLVRQYKFKLVDKHAEVKKVYGLVTKPDVKVYINVIKRTEI